MYLSDYLICLDDAGGSRFKLKITKLNKTYTIVIISSAQIPTELISTIKQKKIYVVLKCHTIRLLSKAVLKSLLLHL